MMIGAAVWVSLLVPLGYAFADSEIVKKRFELVILAIVFLSSVLPMVIEIASKTNVGEEDVLLDEAVGVGGPGPSPIRRRRGCRSCRNGR